MLRLAPLWDRSVVIQKGYIPACLGLFVRDSRIQVGGIFVFVNNSEYGSDRSIFAYFLANENSSSVERSIPTQLILMLVPRDGSVERVRRQLNGRNLQKGTIKYIHTISRLASKDCQPPLF